MSHKPTNHPAERRGRLLVVALFALAMAWVESAAVLYLRTLINRVQPYQPLPLPPVAGFSVAEIIREAATMTMLASVGWLAGHDRRTRVGYALVAFGVWDIGYYLFLKPLTGWPNSLLDWDILFLIPLPWWGPVIAPCAIAALMIVWGTLVTQAGHERETPWPAWPSRVACAGGIALALYVFMADAIRVAGHGEMALREMLPARFHWFLFSAALLLMAVPVADVWRQFRPRTAPAPEDLA